MNRTIKPVRSLKGTVVLPGDPFISQLMLVVGAISEGTTRIENYAQDPDSQSVLEALRTLGVRIDGEEGALLVHGVGLDGLREPSMPLSMDASPGTLELLLAVLAGQDFQTTVTCEKMDLQRIAQVTDALSQMGAVFSMIEDRSPSVGIRGGTLRSIRYVCDNGNPWVKCALLLAGLYAEGRTAVVETNGGDRSERMFQVRGARVRRRKTEDRKYVIAVERCPTLRAEDIVVPGSLSDGLPFILGATLLRRSEVTVKEIKSDPAKRGILDVMKRMKAKIEVHDERACGGTVLYDLTAKRSRLGRTRIGGDLARSLIDEVPILTVAATQVNGEMLIRDVGDLRRGALDQIAAVVQNLRKMGAKVGEFPDGLIVEGGRRLQGAEIETYGDGRIGMAFAVAGLIAEGDTQIVGAECVEARFPGFFERLEALKG